MTECTLPVSQARRQGCRRARRGPGPVSRSPRSGRHWLPWLTILPVFGWAGSSRALDLPGPAPGSAQITITTETLVVTNALLSMQRRLNTPPGGSGWSIRAPTGALELEGELFALGLTDGTRYVASALEPRGAPREFRQEPEPTASRAASRLPGSGVEASFASPDGRLAVRWRLLALDDANYFRQELELRATAGDLPVREITWLDAPLPQARAAGRVDGSPIVAGNFFLGVEDPMAINEVGREGRVRCRLVRGAPLLRDEPFTSSFVIGVAPTANVRRAFLYYLERERAHPYRPFLHYNSWYDIAWTPFALNETNCLEAIRHFGERFIQPHGVVLDALVFDDGWDNPQTLWQFHAGFPRGFTPLAEQARKHGTHLGVWLSPFGGYGEPREQRLAYGRAQGYETNTTGFSLAGPRYHAAFKRACVGMIRDYGVNHFKFDGIAAGMYADGSAEYLRDTEAMRRLMVELRQEAPHLYINLTTGSWPSPFWLRHADSVWRQGGDMGLAGKGTKQQQWLTYRDQEVYRNIVGKGPLYPLNSLMTQGVAYSRQGAAGEPSFNSAGFKDDVRAFFGSGTGLQELYIQPNKLTAEDWRVLAEAAKWSRANADVLVDTHWIGGDPGRLEVYGYASWSRRLGIVMLRNPDERPVEFGLELAKVFELPPGAPTRYALARPWPEDRSREAVELEAGQPLRLTLRPFEVRVLEATPLPTYPTTLTK